jgi:hypothetical protein
MASPQYKIDVFQAVQAHRVCQGKLQVAATSLVTHFGTNRNLVRAPHDDEVKAVVISALSAAQRESLTDGCDDLTLRIATQSYISNVWRLLQSY